VSRPSLILDQIKVSNFILCVSASARESALTNSALPEGLISEADNLRKGTDRVRLKTRLSISVYYTCAAGGYGDFISP
jgi:hypothetical protein